MENSKMKERWPHGSEWLQGAASLGDGVSFFDQIGDEPLPGTAWLSLTPTDPTRCPFHGQPNLRIAIMEPGADNRVLYRCLVCGGIGDLLALLGECATFSMVMNDGGSGLWLLTCP